MELNNKKVLITGAGGFIGSHLVESVLSKGANVRVFLRYKSNGDLGHLKNLSPELLEKIEIVRGDLKNLESVRRAVNGCDIVFHLGALISIPHSYLDPLDFVETNIVGTSNVLIACRESAVKKIILTSTSEVYGTAIYSPINESHPLQAQSPYSASKMSADKIAESFLKTYGLPIAIARPFNAYGPRQSVRAVIPTIIYQALTHEKIKIGSLAPMRDFTFVRDTVEGFIKIAESDNSVGEVFNFGSGKTISIGDLVKTISNLIGKDFEVETDEKKLRPEKSEVQLLLCDNSKAREVLNWEPKITLESGLRECINYIRQNLENYKSELSMQYT